MQSRGFVAISAVLVIASVVLVIGITVSMLAIGEGQAGLALYKGESALDITESCMEEALWQSRQSSSYTGGTISFTEGSCTVTVSKVGNVWTITSTGTATDYRRSVQVVMTRGTSAITLTSWKEI